jgi:hypothetical protein
LRRSSCSRASCSAAMRCSSSSRSFSIAWRSASSLRFSISVCKVGGRWEGQRKAGKVISEKDRGSLCAAGCKKGVGAGYVRGRVDLGVSDACVPPAGEWPAGGIIGLLLLRARIKSKRLRAHEALAGWECLRPKITWKERQQLAELAGRASSRGQDTT